MNTVSVRSRSEGGAEHTPLRGTAPAAGLPASLAASSSPPPREDSSWSPDLRASLLDSAAFNVMVGTGESFIPAFVLALGLGEVAAGLVISVPVLAGALLQMISPWAVNQLGSHRRWVLTCILVQAASFVPLLCGALYGSVPVWVLFSIVAVYWAGGLGSVPAWNAWMETLIPGQVRAPFFAMRSRIGQAGLAAGFVIGGVTLQLGKNQGWELPAFAAMFGVAALARCGSFWFVRQQQDLVPGDLQQRHVSFGELCRRIWNGGSERILLYFLSVQLCIQCSGPYFAPYMLHQMKVSYIRFMALLGVAFLGKIIAFPLSGRLAARYGAQRLIWIGGMAIVPVAGLWLFADTFWKIFAVQFIAGLCWAPYELAVFLLFFETIRREERTSILTMFNLCNSAALAVASICGGLFLKFLGECPPAYLALFVLSSCLRCFTLIFLRITPKHIMDEPASVVPAPAFVERKRTAPVHFADSTTVAAPPE